MQAWQKQFGSKAPVRNEVPVPSAPADGVLVKIHAAGVCHSDVALSQQEPQPPGWSAAYTLGHEGCGEVVEVGSSVGNFKIGDMVAILSVPGCGKSTCYRCKRGVPQICEECERYGIGSNGSYAPYIAVKERSITKLPDGVPPEVGAVATDACMTAYHAIVGTAQLRKDETVVIVGIGGLGFNAMQIAQAIGARVVVTDRRQEVLDEAVKFGIPKEDVVPIAESLVEFVKKNNLLIDTVVDFVGVPETFSASQEAGMSNASHLPFLVQLAYSRYSTIRWEAGSSGASCTSTNHRQFSIRSEAIVDNVQLWRNYGGPSGVSITYIRRKAASTSCKGQFRRLSANFGRLAQRKSEESHRTGSEGINKSGL
jgi:propanol-preferring alcohol dehydrogenase